MSVKFPSREVEQPKWKRRVECKSETRVQAECLRAVKQKRRDVMWPPILCHRLNVTTRSAGEFRSIITLDI